MKQLNNDNSINIFTQKNEKEKLSELIIENYSLEKNNFLGKINSKININLSLLNNNQYLYHKLFEDNSFILMGNTSLILFPNIFKDNKDYLSTKISFYYEKQYKINSYQINQDKYLIINGKSIILIEKNKKLLISKTYNRLTNIAIISVINSEEEKDKFSGFLIKIQCIVSYENINNNKNIKESICIQNFILPQFEKDIIIDFRLIYFNLDENRLYQIYKNKIVIFVNNNNIFYYLINDNWDKNNINKDTNKIKEIENEIIDYMKIREDYLFVFYKNTHINIYKIEFKDINNPNKVELKLIQRIDYNKHNIIIMKRKLFFNKKDNTAFIYYMDYLSEQFFFFFKIVNNDKQKINNIIPIYFYLFKRIKKL